MSAFLYRLGLTLRETGQALDRLGCQLQGNPAYREECMATILSRRCFGARLSSVLLSAVPTCVRLREFDCDFAVFRHRSVLNLPSAVSDIAPNAFVAPSAAVSGKVSVGSNSSIWYGTVVRGESPTLAPLRQLAVQLLCLWSFEVLSPVPASFVMYFLQLHSDACLSSTIHGPYLQHTH